MAASTTAEPRSPWARHSPAPTPASSVIGTIARRASTTSSTRRARRSAASTTTASLRNSDGWTLRPPSRIHELAPLTCAPRPGANGRHIAITPSTPSGITSLRHIWYGNRAATTRLTRPSPAHMACLLKIRYGECPRLASVTADADSTITRPSITNTATTRGDRVVRTRRRSEFGRAHPHAAPSRARASAGVIRRRPARVWAWGPGRTGQACGLAPGRAGARAPHDDDHRR